MGRPLAPPSVRARPRGHSTEWGAGGGWSEDQASEPGVAASVRVLRAAGAWGGSGACCGPFPVGSGV